MTEAVKISIILVNYNTCELTCNCIKSIIKQVKEPSYEIVMVDNASHDDSVAVIEEKYPAVKIIKSLKNIGFGRANNLGAQHANGEYLFILNTDTIINHNPFPLLLSRYENYENPGAIGFFLKHGDGEYAQSGGTAHSMRKYLKIYFMRLFGVKKVVEVKYEDNESIDWIVGADIFIRKDTFLELGGFDEKIFMYHEDVDLGMRLCKNGYKQYLIKDDAITHYESGSTPSIFNRTYNMASLMYVLRKNANPITFFFFQICMFTLRFPLLFYPQFTLAERWKWLITIFNYKNYLNHE